MKMSLSAILASAALALTAHAGFVDHQAALSVLGQSDFTTVVAGAVTSSTLDRPEGVAIDPTTGKVFVSDSNNYRILRFGSVQAYTTGVVAEAVFGQANFSSNLMNRGGTTAANTMGYPTSICVDSAGRLWVPDYDNRRVLRFDHASTKPTGANADGVLGQPDFTTKTAGTTAATMDQPYYVTAGSDGTVWVSEFNNNRVLGFRAAAAKSAPASADIVLGQPDFTTKTAAASAQGLSGPSQIATDGTDTLFVAVYGQSRVLRYGPASVATLTAPAKVTARHGKATIRGASTGATLVVYSCGPGAHFKATRGLPASWSIVLRELKKKITRVTVRASNPDGVIVQKVVRVKST